MAYRINSCILNNIVCATSDSFYDFAMAILITPFTVANLIYCITAYDTKGAYGNKLVFVFTVKVIIVGMKEAIIFSDRIPSIQCCLQCHALRYNYPLFYFKNLLFDTKYEIVQTVIHLK